MAFGADIRKAIEDLFWSKRGGHINARDLANLAQGSEEAYRYGLRAARGNNVRVHNEFRSRNTDCSAQISQKEREMACSRSKFGK
jgi:hypothetical protein